MESYIVRVIRRSSENPEELVGFVEMPESEEQQPFGTINEFMKIFITPDGTGPPNKRKQMVERRKHRRFLMKEGTVIFNSVTDIGEITDISLGGLSFVSTNMVADCPETTEISILCGDEKKNLSNIKCRRIGKATSPDPGKVRRFRLAFDNPTAHQKTLLENILQDCTISEI